MSDNMVCPNCGALIENKEGIFGVCSFCGSKIRLSNEEQANNPEVVIIDSSKYVIKENSYKNNKLIKKVIIPDGIQSIEKSAFENCENLVEINIPRSVKIISDCAFKNTGVKKIVLPNTIEFLGKEVFMNCNRLEHVTIENGAKYSMDQTFKKCPVLNDVDCNLYDFYPSIRKTNETSNKSDDRSTFMDTFQGTPFFYKICAAFSKSRESGICFLCGGTIQKKMFSPNKCLKCGCDYSRI